MQLPNYGSEKARHAVPECISPDRLSQNALQTMHCIKEAAEAQNSGQADTVI